jgi:predicted nucleic acid-binding protein
MYLVDSNIIIYHLNGDNIATNFLLDNSQDIIISFISTIEILSFAYSDEAKIQVEKLLYTFRRIDIDDSIIRTTIKLRGEKKIKLPDCIIAATAIEHNLSLVTRNIKDFEHIETLPIINPFDG